MKLKFTILALAVTLTACVSQEQEIVTEPMTEAELQTALVGKTYPLGGTDLSSSKGAIYFVNANSLEIVWEGAAGTGNWDTNGDSEFCYTQTLWSGRECIALLRNVTEGGYVHVFEGERRYLDEGAIVAGRQL